MNADEHRDFLVNSVGENTYAMLTAVVTFGVTSRTFMIPQLDSGMANLWQRRAEGEDVSSALIARYGVDMLERLCQVIEDFAVFIYALSRPLPDYPANMVRQPAPGKLLSSLTDEDLATALRQCPLSNLPLSEADRDFVARIRARNVEGLRNLVDLLGSLLDTYWVFFTKHKHANTLLYGFEPFRIAGEDGYFVGAVYDRKRPNKINGLIVTRTMYRRWGEVLRNVVTAHFDLAKRTTDYAEQGGWPRAVRTLRCHVTDEEHTRIVAINALCDAGMTVLEIPVELKAEIGPQKTEAFLKLQARLERGIMWPGDNG